MIEAQQAVSGSARGPLRSLRESATRHGDSAAAESAFARVVELAPAASARPLDPLAQSTMHYRRAMLALAQNDTTAAKTEFAQCSREDEYCKWQGVMAAEKSGDKAAATTMREAILKTYKRDPPHLVVRSRLTPARTTST